MKTDEMEPQISRRLSRVGAESHCEVLGELPARWWALVECTACCTVLEECGMLQCWKGHFSIMLLISRV